MKERDTSNGGLPVEGNLDGIAQSVCACADELERIRECIARSAETTEDISAELFYAKRRLAALREKLATVNAFLAREAAFGEP